MERQSEVACRASTLLLGRRGITKAYARTMAAAGVMTWARLKGRWFDQPRGNVRRRRGKRWFLA